MLFLTRLSCCVALLLSVLPFTAAAIYDTDDRFEIYEGKKDYQTLGRSVALIVPAKNLLKQPDGSYKWNWQRIPLFRDVDLKHLKGAGFAGKIEPTARFAEQPLCGIGTAFLINTSTVITAGHCVVDANGDEQLSDKLVVFGCAIDPNTGRVPDSIPASNVVRCVETLAIDYKVGRADDDWAIIRLEKSVTGRPSLTMRVDGKIEDRNRLLMIGHPYGLPMKLTIGARVRNNERHDFFTADLDSFPGNSGSPVFNASTRQVEGILVRGPKKEWIKDAGTGKAKLITYKAADAAVNGAHVQRVTTAGAIAEYQRNRNIFKKIYAKRYQEAWAALKAKESPDLTAVDGSGWTYVHYAARYNKAEFLKWLLDNDASVAPRTRAKGWSPLHLAARYGAPDAAKVLVDFDHPMNVTTKHNWTPFKLAEKYQPKIAEYLKDQGANTKIVPFSKARNTLNKLLAGDNSVDLFKLYIDLIFDNDVKGMIRLLDEKTIPTKGNKYSWKAQIALGKSPAMLKVIINKQLGLVAYEKHKKEHGVVKLYSFILGCIDPAAVAGMSDELTGYHQYARKLARELRDQRQESPTSKWKSQWSDVYHIPSAVFRYGGAKTAKAFESYMGDKVVWEDDAYYKCRTPLFAIVHVESMLESRRLELLNLWTDDKWFSGNLKDLLNRRVSSYGDPVSQTFATVLAAQTFDIKPVCEWAIKHGMDPKLKTLEVDSGKNKSKSKTMLSTAEQELKTLLWYKESNDGAKDWDKKIDQVRKNISYIRNLGVKE